MSCDIKRKHPFQNIVVQKGHEPYFLENKIIVTLLEEFGVDDFFAMLKKNNKDYNVADLEQFFQLIGVKCDYFMKCKDFSQQSRDDLKDIVNKIKNSH